MIRKVKIWFLNKIGKLKKWFQNIDWGYQIAITFFVGILFTSLISPIVVPPFQNAEAGFLEPNPDIKIQYRNTSTTGHISDTVEVDLTERRYRTYFVDVSNPTQKIINDLNLALLFSGCPLAVETQFTNLDAAIVSRSSDEINTNNIANFLNRGCGASIDIEELPPRRWARIFVIVDTERVDKNIPENERLDPFEVGIYMNYQWEMNGRSYYESPEDRITVDDKLAHDELYRPVFRDRDKDWLN